MIKCKKCGKPIDTIGTTYTLKRSCQCTRKRPDELVKCYTCGKLDISRMCPECYRQYRSSGDNLRVWVLEYIR